MFTDLLNPRRLSLATSKPKLEFCGDFPYLTPCFSLRSILIRLVDNIYCPFLPIRTNAVSRIRVLDRIPKITAQIQMKASSTMPWLMRGSNVNRDFQSTAIPTDISPPIGNQEVESDAKAARSKFLTVSSSFLNTTSWISSNDSIEQDNYIHLLIANVSDIPIDQIRIKLLQKSSTSFATWIQAIRSVHDLSVYFHGGIPADDAVFLFPFPSSRVEVRRSTTAAVRALHPGVSTQDGTVHNTKEVDGTTLYVSEQGGILKKNEKLRIPILCRMSRDLLHCAIL